MDAWNPRRFQITEEDLIDEMGWSCLLYRHSPDYIATFYDSETIHTVTKETTWAIFQLMHGGSNTAPHK